MRVGLGLFLALALVAPAPAQAETAVPVGDCAWLAHADADRLNVAYPDESAGYWLGAITATPGTRLRIRGRFPHARYMSFHVYEGSIPIDHLTDTAIEPESGINPFRRGARRDRGGRYAVDLVPGAPPADGRRKPNTLYAGGGKGGAAPPAVTFIYRVYLAEGDATGGVGLPTAQVIADGGANESPETLPSCQASTPLPGGVNDQITGASLPFDWPGGAPTASAKPDWGVNRSGGVNPFFPNFDNVYLSLLVQRDQGSVIAFRAKAPTFVHTRGRKRFGHAQLRFWSICTNDQPSTRYAGCLADQDAKLDRKGYVNVVISDVAHKPRRLAKRDNWLPWGPYAGTFVLWRHMLPARGFKQAAQRIPEGKLPKDTMGAYYPRTVVCGPARFDRDRCGL